MRPPSCARTPRAWLPYGYPAPDAQKQSHPPHAASMQRAPAPLRKDDGGCVIWLAVQPYKVHRLSQWLAAVMDARASCVVLYVLGRYSL